MGVFRMIMGKRDENRRITLDVRADVIEVEFADGTQESFPLPKFDDITALRNRVNRRYTELLRSATKRLPIDRTSLYETD